MRRPGAASACLWIVLVVVAGASRGTEEAATCHVVPDASPDEARASAVLTLPDVTLVDQHGEAVHFHRDLVADRLVAINFVFTTCTTVCPPMGAQFARLAALLDERGDRDVALVSVSVDPHVDTPARLRAWSERFGASARWRLVTGDKRTVDDLLKALGVFTPDKTDHAPILLLGNDATGTWQRTSGFTPADVVAQQLAALSSQSDKHSEVGR